MGKIATCLYDEGMGLGGIIILNRKGRVAEINLESKREDGSCVQMQGFPLAKNRASTSMTMGEKVEYMGKLAGGS